MRKFAKFLIPALLIVAIVAAFAIFASAEEKVVYVSSTGTGDGTSATSPIGPGLVNGEITNGATDASKVVYHTFTDTPYAEAVAKLHELQAGGKTKLVGDYVWKASPLYRAFEAMGTSSGTIVVMDEVAIEVADRMENGSAADATIPTTITGKITVTSNYGGTDYRTSGAKLVFDQSHWTSVNLSVRKASVTYKDLDIKHLYNSTNSPGSWTRAAIFCHGTETVFDTGLKVESYDIKSGTPTKTASQISIFAGGRFQPYTTGNVTVKSGDWLAVYGSGHSMSSTNHGSLSGNSTINVEGGKIATLYGGGSTLSNRKYASIDGNLAVNVTGGEITKIQALSSAGVKGEVAINVKYPAKVGEIAYGSGTNTPTKAEVTYDVGTVDAAKIDSKFTAAAKEFVIFVSATGTGDGSSPENALGPGNVTGKLYKSSKSDANVVADWNNVPYATAVAEAKTLSATYPCLIDGDNALLKASPVYRAFLATKDRDATIVFIDEVKIETGDRMEYSYVSGGAHVGSGGGPAEYKLPKTNNTVKLTTTYGGVNYASTKDAKLVFDRSTWNSINIQLECETVWENLTFEHRQAKAYCNNVSGGKASYIWPTNGMIFFSGYDTVIGNGVTTKATTDGSATSGSYAMLFAGKRYQNVTTDADGQQITIKSGLWHYLGAAGCGMNAANPGIVTGNVEIVVEKATSGTSTNIVDLAGGGHTTRGSAYVDGNVTITVKSGARVQNNLYALTGAGCSGHVVINVNEGAILSEKTSFVGAHYQNGTAVKTVLPQSVKLNFYTTALYEEDINTKGDFETAPNVYNPIDKAPVTPPPPSTPGSGTPAVSAGQTVIYIANESKGTGDGSTPANAMGHDSDYYTTLARMKELLAKGTLSTTESSEFTTLKAAQYKKHAFYKAVMANSQAIVKNGGAIVIVDELTFDTGDGFRASFSEFPWHASSGSKFITLTSYYDGVDYRASGAKLIFDTSVIGMNVRINAPSIWEYLNIENIYNTARTTGDDSFLMLSFYGKQTIIDEEVSVVAKDIRPSGKITRYPTLTGYDRLGSKNAQVVANPNITINSGSWGEVYGSAYGSLVSGIDQYGALKGDVTVTVNGGYISKLIGTSRDDWTAVNVGVTGNVTINVNGGQVVNLYGTNHIDVAGKITVTVAKEAVGMQTAWGSTNKVVPTSAEITYDRAAVQDENVLYWTKTTAQGVAPVIPEDVVYVADVARGTGDGSSPENAIGAAAGYNDKYNRVVEIMSIAAANRTQAEKDELTALKSAYKESALYRAMSKLTAKGGIVVFVGPTTVNTTDSLADNTSNGDFQWPVSGNKRVTFTSVYDGVDYRTQGAKFIIDRSVVGVSFDIKTPILWENLNIDYVYNSSKSTGDWSHSMIWLRGYHGVFGEGLKVTPIDVHTTKSECFPTIAGGHRYSDQNGDTQITINSGTWGTVFGSNYGRISSNVTYGHRKGNVTINVTGGKITKLIGTSRDDSTTCKPIVTGNITINISGNAEVVTLYAANRYGVNGKIVTNVTGDSYVGTAWGYHYTSATKDAQPTDATINYVRSAIHEADVKYWTTVNATGEGEPGIHGPVIYVATYSRGTGDGSSPENALGNASDYWSVRAQALAYINANGGNNAGLPDAQSKVVTSVYKKSALYLALSKNNNQIINEGGTIVVCEPLVINATDGMRRSLADFRWPADGSKTIKITSVHDGVDYRWRGAKVVLDTVDLGLSIDIKSPTYWDAVVIEHRYNSKNGKGVNNGAVIAAGGNEITFGYCVTSTAVDVREEEDKRVEIYPSIAGGGRYSDYKKDTRININGGQWAMVVGGTWTGANTGHTTIGIGGGKIGTICGTTQPTSTNSKYMVTGTAWIGLWAGEVDNVYGVGKNGIKWGSVGVAVGKDMVINGKVYATHPDYEGDTIPAFAYYNAAEVDEKKLVGFSTTSPQTGSPLVYLAAVAIIGLVGTSIVISKKRSKIED